MTDLSPSGTTPSRPSILGIWRLGEPIHRSNTAELCLAQPADAVGSPRWDYVIKRALGGQQDVESHGQIAQFVAAAGSTVHPNLIAVLDASCTGVSPYVVMPYLTGRTMQSHLEGSEVKPLPVSLWLVRQVAQALDALHSAGWVHGDVKPENAIVGAGGHVTLVDLGFAAKTHTVSSRRFRGTPAFAAPESLSSDRAAMPPMDVFSLGRTLWQCLTATESAPTLMLEPVAELIEQMVAEDPDSRPTAAAVACQLLRFEIETLGRHIGPNRSRRAA